ncbi:hypothetical protein Tco_0622023 [Tanacetum coccineum]
MTSGREITPPLGFLAILTTTTMFAAITLENTPLAYRASTPTNPNLVISPAFVEANYETLESLLRDRRRQMRNNDLRTKLEYFSEDYDEEREIEPRPEPARAVTPPLRVASPRVRRRGKETRSLVEHLSTELPLTYKGIMEKLIPGSKQEKWLLMTSQVIKEIVSKDQRNSPRTTTKDRKTKKGEGKKDKSTAPVEAPILMISRENYAAKDTVSKSMAYKEGITFPLVTRVSNPLVIIKAAVFRRKNNHAENGNLGLNNSRGQFHTKKGVGTVLSVGEAGEETKNARRTLTISKERIPNYDDTEEKIIMNDKHPK